MKQRCLNPRNPEYKNYGGRGITVCTRWLKFENFLADMGNKPEGKTLDRVHNELGYKLENCKWSTPVEQNRHMRKNIWITIGNESLILQDWAKKFDVCQVSLRRWHLARLWPQNPNYRGRWAKRKFAR
jgi:hypothetical protein